MAVPSKQRTNSDKNLLFPGISSTHYHLDVKSSYVDSTDVLGVVCEVHDIRQSFCPLGAYTLLAPYWEYLSPCLSPTARL